MTLGKIVFVFACLVFFAIATKPVDIKKILETAERGLEKVIKENMKSQYGAERTVNDENVRKQISENFACLDVSIPQHYKENIVAEDGIKWLGVTKALSELKSGKVPAGSKKGNFKSYMNQVVESLKINFRNMHTLEKIEKLIGADKIKKKYAVFGDYEVANWEGITAKERECIGSVNGLTFLNQQGSVEKARDYAKSQIDKSLNELAEEIMKSPGEITFQSHIKRR